MQKQDVSWRTLGSFERLLARKAADGPSRLSIPHVCAAIIDGPGLTREKLAPALAHVVQRHPLLRACIQGDGKVIDPPAAGVRAGGQEPNPFRWSPINLSDEQIVSSALNIMPLGGNDASRPSWQSMFEKALDGTDFDVSNGPLWRVTALTQLTSTVLVFAFNHGISDQMSSNIIIDQLLTELSSNQQQKDAVARRPFPPSIEQAVLGNQTLNANTARYLLRQGLMGVFPTTLLPDASPATELAVKALPASVRKTICEFRTLPAKDMADLKEACRRRGLTITSALAAAMLYTTSDYAHQRPGEGAGDNDATGQWNTYKLLLSLNMRAYSARRVNNKVSKRLMGQQRTVQRM